MRERNISISAWNVGAVAVVALTAACVSTQPVYTGPVVGPAQGADAGPAHFVSAPYSQCVPYARQRSGFDIYGDASLWWKEAGDEGYPRSLRPAIGAVMVLQVGAEGGRGHLAYVTQILSSRQIIVDHANWHGHGEVAVNVPVVDVSANNDWSAVKVLWVETGQMGAHAYPVEGFVLPPHALGS
jgi:hypothetical protein